MSERGQNLPEAIQPDFKILYTLRVLVDGVVGLLIWVLV
jgi:hypothetical protein